MSEDYKPGKFEDGFVLSEKEFSESVTLALVLVPFLLGLALVSSGVERRVESNRSSESSRVEHLQRPSLWGGYVTSLRFLFCVIPHS